MKVTGDHGNGQVAVQDGRALGFRGRLEQPAALAGQRAAVILRRFSFGPRNKKAG